MEKIMEVVLYVSRRLEKTRVKVGRTRIMKILYLADLIAKSKLGRTITKTEYRYYFYGPYSREVIDAIIKLKNEGYLTDNTELTKFGLAHDYRPTEKAYKAQFEHLTKEEAEILDSVIRKFGRNELLRLLDVVYATEPMRKAFPGEVLRL
ncbi:MAG: Panacea domain-containing protein [Candidatus Korarchaeota archaeon]|nr:Panacea domain-containing protein [Candidatus Korarchaeota archaeon]